MPVERPEWCKLVECGRYPSGNPCQLRQYDIKQLGGSQRKGQIEKIQLYDDKMSLLAHEKPSEILQRCAEIGYH